MANKYASLEVHAEATSRALQKLASQMRDRRAPNKAIAIQLHSWVLRNFDAEGALNKPWKSLSPKYAAWKAKKGYDQHILRLSGHLRDSYDIGFDNDSATVGTDLVYAEFHEKGLPERNLPARPMLPPKAVALQDSIDVYNLFLRNSVRSANLK
jgi:phage gpG-like protein